MKRRSVSSRERTRLFVLHGGTCHLCGRRIAPGEAWHVEHVKPLALGGSDEDANRRPAHEDCHAPKTKADVGMIAKADRQRAAHVGAKPRSKRLMPGSRKSPWKKTVNHGWVRRDEA